MVEKKTTVADLEKRVAAIEAEVRHLILVLCARRVIRAEDVSGDDA